MKMWQDAGLPHPESGQIHKQLSSTRQKILDATAGKLSAIPLRTTKDPKDLAAPAITGTQSFTAMGKWAEDVAKWASTRSAGQRGSVFWLP